MDNKIRNYCGIVVKFIFLLNYFLRLNYIQFNFSIQITIMNISVKYNCCNIGRITIAANSFIVFQNNICKIILQFLQFFTLYIWVCKVLIYCKCQWSKLCFVMDTPTLFIHHSWIIHAYFYYHVLPCILQLQCILLWSVTAEELSSERTQPQ